MAVVTINELDCGVTYTILAGGTYNGSLVGPLSNHGSITEICLSSIPNGNRDRGNHFGLYTWTHSTKSFEQESKGPRD